MTGSAVGADRSQEFTDGLDRTVQIPVSPGRIVALHDLSITLPPIELGADVVGSHGRKRDDGSTYPRSVNTLFGVDFHNSDIQFIGAFDAIDLETMASVKPDLIIGRALWDEPLLEQLEAIAPTVLLEETTNGMDFYRDIADVSARLPVFERLQVRHESLLADARTWIDDPDSLTYAMIQSNGTELQAYATYGAITLALDQLGLQPNEPTRTRLDRGQVVADTISAERLPEQNADFVFDIYRIDQGKNDSPAAASERMEAIVPGWCRVFEACREGRYILLHREHANVAFRTLELNVHYLVTHIGGYQATKAD